MHNSLPCNSTQVQQARDALAEERGNLGKAQEALATTQLLLAESSSQQQQLQSQLAAAQLQAEESAAQYSNLQSMLTSSEAKLAASEADLAEARSQVAHPLQLHPLRSYICFQLECQIQTCICFKGHCCTRP